MAEKRVGLHGATSSVRQCLLPLLRENGWQVMVFSRHQIKSCDQDVQWIKLPNSPDYQNPSTGGIERKDFWICAAPSWVLPDYFPMMGKYCVRRIIALSSTSRFTKSNSSDSDEMVLARQLSESEDRLFAWAHLKTLFSRPRRKRVLKFFCMHNIKV